MLQPAGSVSQTFLSVLAITSAPSTVLMAAEEAKYKAAGVARLFAGVVLPDAAFASPDMVTDLLEGGARWHQEHAARFELLVLRLCDKGHGVTNCGCPPVCV